MQSNNMNILQIVADGLEELKDEIVFVGGAVAELYADDPAASDIRPTQDVDCVIELSTRMEYTELEEKLRMKKFIHDTSKGAPICRWIFRGIKVDVMPTNEDILGFKNRWYSSGIENKITKSLPNGMEIYVFPPEFFLASKFEAHHDRGGNDLRQSSDFEDIIYILDNYTGILENIRNANEDVKNYIIKECQNLLKTDALLEGIECTLPYRSDSDRVEIIENLISEISKIE